MIPTLNPEGVSKTTLQSLVGVITANNNMHFAGQNFTATHPSTLPAWPLTQATITAGAALAPDKSNTGWKLAETSANSNHNIASVLFWRMHSTAGIVYRCSTIVKAAGRDRIVLAMRASDSTAGFPIVASAGFNLATGQTGYDNQADTGWTNFGSTITSLPNGWYLCQFDAVETAVNSPAPNAYIFFEGLCYLDSGSGTAARSISYTGNGTSGIYLWWINTIPKAMVGINQVDFFDDFTSGTSNIDVTNTQAAGFNWYPSQSWPNASPGLMGYNLWTQKPGDFLPATNYSVANSVCTITRGVASNVGLWTAADAPNTDSGFVGRVWKHPVIYEFSVAFEPQPDPNSASPAMWAQSLEMLTGRSTTFIEMDMPDVGTQPGGGNWGILQWDVFGFYQFNVGVSPNNFAYGGNAHIAAADDNAQHRFTTAMFTEFENDGVSGGGMHFFDGVMCPEADIHYSRTVNYDLGGNCPAGAFLPASWHHWPLIISAFADTRFPEWPGLFDYVRVYRPPAGAAATLSAASVTGHTATTANVSVTTNVGNGAIYWVASTSSTPPSATKIIGNKDSVGPVTTYGVLPVYATGAQTYTITELLPSTPYFIYMTQEVNNGAISTVTSTSVTTNAASAYVGPGDLTTSDAVGWWGTRAYSSKTAGHKCLILAREVDANYQLFSTVESTGLLDQTAINTFAGTSTVHAVLLWNQSLGAPISQNGVPAVLSTFGTITNAPILTTNALNSHPVLVHSRAATTTSKEYPFPPEIPQPFTVSLLAERTNNFTTLQNLVNGGENTPYVGWKDAANTVVINCSVDIVGAPHEITATATDSAYHRIQATGNGTSSNLYVDGVNNTGNAGTVGFPAIHYVDGLKLSGGDVKMTELGVWLHAFSGTENTNVDANQKTYGGL